jgi:hypothetical protein
MKAHESERIPILHGIADRFFWNRSCLTILIPFNVVYRILRTILEIIKIPHELWWERNKCLTKKD